MRLVNIDAINGTFAPNEQYTGREVMALLEQQPSLWIPVAERLPEDILSSHRKVYSVLVCTKNGTVHSCNRQLDPWYGGWHWGRIKDVVAWMPLPEPYRPVN